jgi:hypothetical protein
MAAAPSETAGRNLMTRLLGKCPLKMFYVVLVFTFLLTGGAGKKWG